VAARLKSSATLESIGRVLHIRGPVSPLPRALVPGQGDLLG
jgi:hypothetical protein